MWDLSRPGLEPMSPAVADRFLTTVPPGKSPPICFWYLPDSGFIECLWKYSLLFNLFEEFEKYQYKFCFLYLVEFACETILSWTSVGREFFKITDSIFLKILFIYLFIYLFWLCWVFVSVRGLSLVAASGGHSSSRCMGLSLSRPLLLRSMGFRRSGSVVVAHGPSCSVACGIFPDQGSNPCPLHWQADSQPPRHQGSPLFCF